MHTVPQSGKARTVSVSHILTQIESSHNYELTHARQTDTKLTNYLGSVQTEFTWRDGRYARAQMNRGGADACAFGRGGATFDQLTTDSRYQTESLQNYVSASGAISVCIYHWITIVSQDYTRYNINNAQALTPIVDAQAEQQHG